MGTRVTTIGRSMMWGKRTMRRKRRKASTTRIRWAGITTKVSRTGTNISISRAGNGRTTSPACRGGRRTMRGRPNNLQRRAHSQTQW